MENHRWRNWTATKAAKTAKRASYRGISVGQHEVGMRRQNIERRMALGGGVAARRRGVATRAVARRAALAAGQNGGWRAMRRVSERRTASSKTVARDLVADGHQMNAYGRQSIEASLRQKTVGMETDRTKKRVCGNQRHWQNHSKTTGGGLTSNRRA